MTGLGGYMRDATGRRLDTVQVLTTSDLLVLNAVNAALRQGAILPLPPIATRGMWPTGLSNGTDTEQISRIRHTLTSDATSIRLLYVNQYGSESLTYAGASVITITAGLELPDGTILPVTFNGANSVSLRGGQMALSDPVPVALLQGSYPRSRTYVTVPAGGKWPTGFTGSFFGTNEDGAEKGTGAVGDKSKSGTIANPGGIALYGPAALIGATGKAPFAIASYAGIGDSIMWGQGDDPNAGVASISNSGRGFFERALGGTRPFVNVGFPGETAAQFVPIAGHAVRSAIIQGASRAVVEYGRNDLTAGATAAAVMANAITIWNLAKGYGMKVWQTTITPYSTSTDGWLTVAAQTGHASEAQRVAFNNWLRDGAPMLNGAAVATGSSAAGTLRAGASGHPLSGIHDVTAAVESAKDSGLWAQDPAYRAAVPGLSTTAGGYGVTSDTAQFTSADVGKVIRIPGAGTGGAVFAQRIGSLLSATQVGLAGPAVLAVTSVTGQIGRRLTSDGLHPNPDGTILMASAVNIATMDAL